jgi:RimJ/RimL family protein N-acetyltransferase
MERLGMRPDGTFEHPRMPEGSPLRLHYLYRMSREQWIERSLAATRSTQGKAGV